MLSVDNFYKVTQIQIICPRKCKNAVYPLKIYKYRVYLNKDVCHSTLYVHDVSLKLSGYYSTISRSRCVELYIPLEVAVGDYLCIVDNIPSEEDVWNLLSEVNDPELIKTLTKMLLHEI